MRRMKNNVSYSQKNYFEKWIIRKRNRITRRNKNWLCAVCGETGSGKSYLAGRISELIDPSFIPCIIENGIRSRVAIGDAAELNDILKSGTLKRGNMIIFDEAGIAIGSRDWFTEMNKVTMYILQTFRHMNIGVIFTVPDINFLDKQARALFHTYLECLKINFNTNKVLVKPFELQNNPYEGQVYKKYPRFESNAVTRFKVCKPSKEFIKRYEPLKKELSNRLGERMDIVKERLQIKERRRLTDAERMEMLDKANINVFNTNDACAFLGCDRQLIYRLQNRANLIKRGIIKQNITKR